MVRRFLRRVRGALGLSTVWAGVTSVVAAAWEVGRLLIGPYPFNPEWVWSAVVSFLPVGFLAGLLYSLVVARVEHDPDTLTPTRSGVWGAGAGAVAWWGGWTLNGLWWVPVFNARDHIVPTAICAVVGFAVGATIAHLARRAETGEGVTPPRAAEFLAEAPPSWAPGTPAADPATVHRRP